MSPWNCSAVLDGQLYTHSRSHWPSTSACCHSAEVGRTALSIESFGRRRFFCCRPVVLEFTARQSSWPRTESRDFQMSAEDIHFCEILMTKCIKHIRDFFEYALNKFTLYLLTHLLTTWWIQTKICVNLPHWFRLLSNYFCPCVPLVFWCHRMVRTRRRSTSSFYQSSRIHVMSWPKLIPRTFHQCCLGSSAWFAWSGSTPSSTTPENVSLAFSERLFVELSN